MLRISVLNPAIFPKNFLTGLHRLCSSSDQKLKGGKSHPIVIFDAVLLTASVNALKVREALLER